MLLAMLMTTSHIVVILILKTQFQVLNSLLHYYLISLLLSTNHNKLANIYSNAIHNSSSEKLLGIIIDTKLKFDIHVNNQCRKVCQKPMLLQELCLSWM